MHQRSSGLRYIVALFALLAGLILTIRWSERGVLFDSPSATALTSHSQNEGDDDWDLSSMRIFNQVLLQVRGNYVDPDRIDARKMLVYAINQAQNNVSELVAIFDKDLDSTPTKVEITVGSASKTFDLSDVRNSWQLSFKLREIFSFIQENIQSDKTDLQDLEYAAINGMLSTLDPHSSLLPPKVYKEMQNSNRGSFGGLGIVISIRDDKLTVISPIADTPASRAGFKAGDHIVKINDESTINMSLNEAVTLLRGEPGSKAVLEIMRDGWAEPHEFEITREIINIESVSHQQLERGIGYVAIRSFQGNTHDDLLTALSDLKKKGPIKGLILDLRNDPGGLLQQAILVSDTFLSRGTIVTTVGSGNNLRDETTATDYNTQPDYPIVVLTNAGSASASEIVTGALKRHDRAIIVGDVTFGKGSVQNIYPFSNGSALKLTIAQYLTPGDISIQGVGIMPDIHLVPAVVSSDTLDLYPPSYVTREGDLKDSLTNEYARDANESPFAVVRYYEKPEETDPSHVEDPNEFKIDFEIGFAERLLRAAGRTSKRPAFLDKVQPIIQKEERNQSLQIQEKLRQLNVNWVAGPTVQQPLDIQLTTNKKNDRARAGETIKVTAKVTNKGNETLYRLRGMSSSDYDLLDDLEFAFGKVGPGESASWTVNLDVPEEALSRIDQLTLHMWSDVIDLDQKSNLRVEIDGKELPHWGFSWWIDDTEEGNGDGQLQEGETVAFNMLIHNTGAGDAGETVSYIRNKSDANVFIHQGRQSIEKLAAGGATFSSFRFTVQKTPEEGFIKLAAEVLDTQTREFLSEALEIPVVAKKTNPIEKLDASIQITASTAPIYSAPDSNLEPLAEAARDVIVHANGKTAGWYRITWNDNRLGWLPDAAAQQKKRLSPRGNIKDLLQYQAPQIDLEHDKKEVSGATYTLRGMVTDESKVLDYYVLVNSRIAPHRRQTTKRAYRSVNAASAPIHIDLPLELGNNEILVVAEDDEGIQSTARIHVYRHD